MALRSATECAAIFDVFKCPGLADEETAAAGRDILLRVVSMLTRMVRNLPTSGTGTGTGTESRDRQPSLIRRRHAF